MFLFFKYIPMVKVEHASGADVHTSSRRKKSILFSIHLDRKSVQRLAGYIVYTFSIRDEYAVIYI